MSSLLERKIFLREIDILKDILHDRVRNQLFYNESLVALENPEIQQLLAKLRDEEMEAVIRLRQRIARVESTYTIQPILFTSK